METGFTPKYLKVCAKSKSPLITYNYNKRGDDREALKEFVDVAAKLVSINATGVFKQKTMKKGVDKLMKEYNLMKGMSSDYADQVLSMQPKCFNVV